MFGNLVEEGLKIISLAICSTKTTYPYHFIDKLPAMAPIPKELPDKEFPDNVKLWMMIEEPPPITLDLRFCSQFLDVFGQF